MAQPTKGTKTLSNINGQGLTFTLAHTQDVGPKGFLMVYFQTQDGAAPITGITYGGVAMVEIQQLNDPGLTQEIVIYGLQSPPTGSNDIVITHSANQWSAVSLYAQSWTDSDGAGNSGQTSFTGSPILANLTVSADSVIFCTCSSTVDNMSIKIDGSLRPSEFDLNSNRWCIGALSDMVTPLTAGSKTVDTLKVEANDMTSVRVEILGATSGRRRIIIQ